MRARVARLPEKIKPITILNNQSTNLELRPITRLTDVPPRDTFQEPSPRRRRGGTSRPGKKEKTTTPGRQPPFALAPPPRPRKTGSYRRRQRGVRLSLHNTPKSPVFFLQPVSEPNQRGRALSWSSMTTRHHGSFWSKRRRRLVAHFLLIRLEREPPLSLPQQNNQQHLDSLVCISCAGRVDGELPRLDATWARKNLPNSNDIQTFPIPIPFFSGNGHPSTNKAARREPLSRGPRASVSRCASFRPLPQQRER
jgi:hypothetical protein